MAKKVAKKVTKKRVKKNVERKGMQEGNECWMGNNEKLRGDEVLEGMVRGERR